LTNVTQIDMDPNGWNTITDAMVEVLGPEGTAPVSHVNGVDFAGKTGSAQTISNALKAKISNKGDFKDNGWFVGFEPRRNPDIVVSVLFESGEHGALAARLAAKVVKAFVDKQRQTPTQLANGSNAPAPEQQVPAPAPTPATPVQQQAQKKSVEITGLWNRANADDSFGGGKFKIRVDPKGAPKPAKAAPGMANVPKVTAAAVAGGAQ
jgi:hypothetical protein